MKYKKVNNLFLLKFKNNICKKVTYLKLNNQAVFFVTPSSILIGFSQI